MKFYQDNVHPKEKMSNTRERDREMENALSPSPAGEIAGRVASLYVYPIKSCRGISLSQASLTPTGTVLLKSR